jgi:hypothetical protein
MHKLDIFYNSLFAFRTDSSDWQLPIEEHEKVTQKINALLINICSFSQDRCVELLSSRSLWPEEKWVFLFNLSVKFKFLTLIYSFAIYCREEMKSGSSHWMNEGTNLAQLRELSRQFELMTAGCEEICPSAPKHSLKSAFNIQVIIQKYIQF